jgi:hypothetical protein
MRPGQIEPNEFERAILGSLSRQAPHEAPNLGRLHVLSREYTGVGSYTVFVIGESASEKRQRPVVLKGVIHMPTVPTGLGAMLYYKGDQPKCLEVYTYGNERWDGVYDGFSIEEES